MKEVQNNTPVAALENHPVLYGYGDTFCKTVDELATYMDTNSDDNFFLITYKYIGPYEGREDVIIQQQLGGRGRCITATDENTYDSFCPRTGEWNQKLGSLEDIYKAFNYHYGIEMEDDVFRDAKERRHRVKEVCESLKI